MKRNALQILETWNTKNRRKPLILWGARQVGKTYLVRDMFAETYYPGEYLYIDFRTDRIVREFCRDTVDAGEIIDFLSITKNLRITQDTLLIFDEIQECPSIITALKYFCQDHREIPVIATGSMVRIRLKRMEQSRGPSKDTGFLFPVGKINQMTLYPMSFDEFLINANEQLYEQITQAYAKGVPLADSLHKLAVDMLHKYLLIGGMPEAVETWLESQSFFESREVLKDLYDNYLSDMELYQASPESVIRARKVYSNIYRELNRDSKHFTPGLIERGTRTRDYRAPIDWLTLANVVHQSTQVREHITVPIIPEDDAKFRLYLGDIGMFSYQSEINPASFLETGSRNTLAGIFMENYVANELIARDLPLYFWEGRGSAEMEFIVPSGGSIYPIDVKKTKGTLNSLEKYQHHNSLDIAIKLSLNNYGYNTDRKLLTLPLYETFLLAEDLAHVRRPVPQ